MTDATEPQVETWLAQLRALTRRGGDIRDDAAASPTSERTLAAARVWQHDCAAVVSQLSGGSKAHWLSRAYSAALLVRAADGGAIVEANAADIVSRVIAVIDRAARSLTQPGGMAASPDEAPPRRRFDFVRHEPLRPLLEEAYIESARALDEADYTHSLMTSCSIIEAMLTDALDGGAGPGRFIDAQTLVPALADMSFGDRIAAAEQRGLIRGGCARLTPAAREYRALGESNIVTARDARVARQVLHVVMRDLDPGR